ncbi:hypothetical protein D3Z51_04700 [Clostridiaceae bacterium]|nr:hypothetical protein [Clostridiaceae bacterium]RKI08521.1 hypothetical protein D7V81_18930 [bacterium 1XD21-70]
MKRKMITTVTLAFSLAMASSFCSFAGQWKQDATGWFYQNTDGSYLSGGWYWVDGKSYYFDGQGYCLSSTTTPDGYTVDESGAWTVDGAVQSREAEVLVSNTKVSIPNGYDWERQEDGNSITLNEKNGSEKAVLVMAIQEESISEVRSLFGEEALKMVSDEVIQEIALEYVGSMQEVSSTTKSLSNGAWYCYSFKAIDGDGKDVPVEFYTNFTGSEIRVIVILEGAGREFTSSDEFVQNCIR